MASQTLRLVGYRDMMRAFAKADRDTKRGVYATLRRAGDLVRSDAVVRFSTIDHRSAAGYRVRARQRGVIVEQSLRKTTGKRPDYGKLQMREALLPAVASNADETERAVEHALDVICDQFNAGGRF